MSLFDLDLAAIVGAYRTCEFATLAKDGTPVTWPAAAWLRPDGTLTLTTSLGFPQKALNIRRDSRVALLFSDPTGSGLDAPEQVVVQGTASCPDEIVTSPGDLADYWATLFERQPSSRAYLNPLMRPVVDWYFMRLVITVAPHHVRTRPQPAPGTIQASGVLGSALLRGFPSAVLGGRAGDGAPVLLRVRPVAVANGYRLDLPEDVKVSPGPASLLVHRHNEKLANLRFALVRGELSEDMTLAPSVVVDPASSAFRTLKRTRRSAKDYLRSRDLARPGIDWAGFAAIAKSV
ncbi:MAG: pyridoxamine 5'-phosphate oxidase family protein [Kibdelosporangium sp.]